jgi:hypothetical protein
MIKRKTFKINNINKFINKYDKKLVFINNIKIFTDTTFLESRILKNCKFEIKKEITQEWFTISNNLQEIFFIETKNIISLKMVKIYNEEKLLARRLIVNESIEIDYNKN